MICSICKKNQSGMIEDYPISKNCPDTRICAKCNDRIQEIKRYPDNRSMTEYNFMYKCYEQLPVDSTAKKYLSVILGEWGKQDANVSEVSESFGKNVYTIDKDNEESIKQKGAAISEELSKINATQRYQVTFDTEDIKISAMFSNIGGKIRTLAKAICWLGIITAVIAGIVQLAAGATLTGLLTMIFGAIGSWLGSFILYGFGELVARVVSIDNKIK